MSRLWNISNRDGDGYTMLVGGKSVLPGEFEEFPARALWDVELKYPKKHMFFGPCPPVEQVLVLEPFGAKQEPFPWDVKKLHSMTKASLREVASFLTIDVSDKPKKAQLLERIVTRVREEGF